MKIVHVINEYHENSNYEENITSRYQKASGHKVYVISAKNTNITRSSKIYIKRSSKNIILIYIPTLINLHINIIYSPFLKSILKKIQPDVVHAHTTCHSFSIISAFYKDLLKFRYIIDCHEFIHDGHILKSNNLIKKLLYHCYFFFTKPFVKYALSKADNIFSVASVCSKYLYTKYGINDHLIQESNLFVDTNLFYRKSELNISYNLPNFFNGKFIIGFSGFITPRKNLFLYLDVLEKLDKNFVFMFIIKIADNDFKNFCSLIDDYNLKDRVLIYRNPSQKIIPDLLSLLDVGLFLSNNSISILEYLSCSVPVICADMQLAYFITPECGKVIPKDSVTEAVNCIYFYFNNPSIKKQHNRNARKHAEKNYSALKNVKKLTNNYFL